jgi:hypothetical protein
MQTTTPAVANVDLVGPCRSLLAYRDNNDQPTLGAGTNGKLYMFRGGLLVDITPAAFPAGNIDAQLASGQYGAGVYGDGAYGIGMESGGLLEDAASWQLDHFGQSMIACAAHDGKLYVKADPATADVATQIANAPVSCAAVVVTPEQFVMALGAGGNDRRIEWSDQSNYTIWTPGPTNQAGGYNITSAGRILAGRRTTAETLIWTDADLWRARFIGGTYVYQIQQADASAGAVSRHAMGVLGAQAFWMGHRSFYMYNGFVQQIPCDVADYVFNDFNKLQRSKVTCKVRSQFGEVTWHYPSAGSVENNRYVTYNYLHGFWYLGYLERTAGVDAQVFGFPIEADSL